MQRKAEENNSAYESNHMKLKYKHANVGTDMIERN